MASLLKMFNGFSFKEKSILISLLAVAVLYGGYFLDMLGGGPEQTLALMLERMVGIVIALVAVHIIFHIVIALDDVEEAEDERDKAVARRASVYGFNVLFVAVLLVTGRIVILGAWAESAPPAAGPDVFEIANLLLAGLIASEVVYYAAQLFFYRRGLQS
jgi:small neutral amino acid transporter SnatA (MarC family)